LKLGVQWDTIAVFFLNFVPLHIESPYNFGGKKPSAESKWACWIVSELFEEKQICGRFSGFRYCQKTTMGLYSDDKGIREKRIQIFSGFFNKNVDF
jgi:hypothetical protein